MAECDFTPQRNLNDRKSRLLFLVSIYRKLMRPLEDCFRGKYTSLQLWTILILDAGGPMPMGKLAEAVRIPKQQMSRLAEGLEAEGILVRKVDPNDRRRLLVGLSEQALAEMNAGWMEFERRAEGLLSVLDESERREFNAAADTMNRLLVKLPRDAFGQLRPEKADFESEINHCEPES